MKLTLPHSPSIQLPRWVLRSYVRMSQTERLVVTWLLVLLVVSGIWSIASYVNAHTILIPQAGGIYREAAFGQPRYINPILAGANDLDVDLSRLVYSSLFKFNSNLELQHDLATDYTISEDSTTYTVHLRNDVRWHDGEPFTADDVVFTIASIQTPDYASPLQNTFQGVTITKQDDSTVVFQLKEPYAPFLSSLTVGIVPEHVWESIAPKNAPLAEQMLKPVGTGPYQFIESKTRRKTGEITEMSFTRNDNYYGSRSYIDEINFSFYPTHDDAVKALLAGKVDGVGFLPLQLRNQVDRRSGINIQRLHLPQYFALFFNQQKSPLLSDSGIRDALALATDRQAIVQEALQSEGEPLHLPIPPGIFAFNDSISQPTYDPERAKQNLEEAGWTDVDGDGIREKNDARLHLVITTTDWPEYVKTAEVIQRQWQTVGVETEIEHYGAGTIQQTIIRPRDYEILLFGEILPAIPDPYPFWHSTQTRNPGLNFSLFKNQEVDKLLEEARKTTNADERKEKYEQFQGIILDLKPALILYQPYYLFAAKTNVRGIDAANAAIPAGRFNNIEQWHVRVKRIWQ
ncbi:MAG: ABC transporter substrate-binding protein [Candidatus Andersenbacteria bacterium]|nr:ABC transporter substrate-binding protein [bacterium]MDZ4225349.1 ABC transporter substrate-binding protein [Candidatus Andersenbacteria bacterium]